MNPSPDSMDGRWWSAPAKLNLYLHITGRRPDGYHDIQTLFQLLDWGDEVFVQTSGVRNIAREAADYDVAAENDLVVLAARRLQEASACNFGARIRVRKNIPIGGGLGGGSSDAATVLVVLNRLWDCGLSPDELAQLAQTIGADVPVFVRGSSAFATGIGETLEPADLGQRFYVLIFPDIAVSTADLYQDEELKRDSAPISKMAALAGEGHNDLEAVARLRYPQLEQMAVHLGQWGQPRMSGSGSVFFIPFESENAANRAAQEMKCRYNVRAVRGVDRSGLHEAIAELA